MGGTGANHLMLGTGDAIFLVRWPGQPHQRRLRNIANPDPLLGTDGRGTPSIFSSDGKLHRVRQIPTSPASGPIRDYLKVAAPTIPKPKLRAGPLLHGQQRFPRLSSRTAPVDAKGIRQWAAPFPPTNIRTIGDALNG